MSTTLSQPSTGYSSKGAPHAAPALLIRKSIPSGSLSVKNSTRLLMPSSFERSEQKGMHSALYSLLSSSALAIKASSFLAVMYTFTPFANCGYDRGAGARLDGRRAAEMFT